MRIIEKLNYREWQKRNTERFNSLTKYEKECARNKGYYNKGWNNIQKSWSIIKPPISFFEHKLKRGDVVGAINLSIIEAERAKQLAHSSIEKLTQNQKNLDSLANETLVL